MLPAVLLLSALSLLAAPKPVFPPGAAAAGSGELTEGRIAMNMTNYMELLANNQPWNLILFMGIPVALAET